MIKYYWLFIGATIVFTIVGCCADTPEDKITSSRIENVKKVFFSNERDVTVVCEDPETKKIEFKNLYRNIEFVSDADPTEPMWVDVEVHSHKYREDKAIVHLHAVQDLTGSSYNTGGKHNRKIQVQELP